MIVTGAAFEYNDLERMKISCLGTRPTFPHALIMKPHIYLIIVLFFSAFFAQISAERVHAAAPAAPSALSLVESEDMLGPGKKTDVWEYVGIGKMQDKVKSPIKTLAEAAQTQGGTGSMGARLRKVMGDSNFNVAEVAVNEDELLSMEIIGADADVEGGASDQGRMYPPRLEINFQTYPTFAMQPAWTSQQTVRLNRQIQAKLNPGSRRSGQSEPEKKNVEIVGDEQGLVLRGTVSSEREKNVLEHFVRMEPGVKILKNELIVRPVGSENTQRP